MSSFNIIYRYTVNMIASVFISISVLFDMGVWYFVKNLIVFDDEKANDRNDVDLTILKNISESEINTNKEDVAKE